MCISVPARKSSFCSRSTDFGVRPMPPELANEEALDAADAGASELAISLTESMKCSSGVCRELAQDCLLLINSLACLYSFPSCDAKGFLQPVCQEACVATELACGATFASVGFSSLSSCGSASFEVRRNVCEPLDCGGCQRGSTCANVLHMHGIETDCGSPHSPGGSRWPVWILVGIAIVLLIVLLALLASSVRSSSQIAPAVLPRTPLLAPVRGPVTSSSYEDLPILVANMEDAPHSEPKQTPPPQRDFMQ